MSEANGTASSSSGASTTSYPILPVHSLEDQLVLRLPPALAEKMRKLVQANKFDRDSVEFTFSDERKGTFKFGGKQYNMVLVDLPCILENNKTLDKITYYKCGDVGQMLWVYEGDKMPSEIDDEFKLNSGITPPTSEIRKRKFRKKKKGLSLRDAENEVLKQMRGGFLSNNENFEVIEEAEVDTDDETTTTLASSATTTTAAATPTPTTAELSKSATPTPTAPMATQMESTPSRERKRKEKEKHKHKDKHRDKDKDKDKDKKEKKRRKKEKKEERRRRREERKSISSMPPLLSGSPLPTIQSPQAPPPISQLHSQSSTPQQTLLSPPPSRITPTTSQTQIGSITSPKIEDMPSFFTSPAPTLASTSAPTATLTSTVPTTPPALLSSPPPSRILLETAEASTTAPLTSPAPLTPQAAPVVIKRELMSPTPMMQQPPQLLQQLPQQLPQQPPQQPPTQQANPPVAMMELIGTQRGLLAEISSLNSQIADQNNKLAATKHVFFVKRIEERLQVLQQQLAAKTEALQQNRAALEALRNQTG
eukprot:TRINITY_DN1364_c0_g1_i1.p1 TRINITY_DN1364_c0_g1~~TRINITY_DN1364_c0_g1_i1.p1  ORF type:complete len:562 (-),score=179.04 TRINITY_DN1364_c0_g1_i1:82-1692(-)